MSNSAVGNVYQTIIEEVINSSRVDFEESGVEEAVLEELRLVSQDQCFVPCSPTFGESLSACPPVPHHRYDCIIWAVTKRRLHLADSIPTREEENTQDIPSFSARNGDMRCATPRILPGRGEQKPGVERSGGLGSGGLGGRHSTIWGPF